MEGLLRPAGLRPDRIWRQQLHHQWDRSSFEELVSGLGQNQVRLARLAPAARTRVLARARRGLNGLAPQDYLWEGETVCAVTTKGTTGRR